MDKLREFIRLVDHAIACADALVKETTGSSQAWMAEDKLAMKRNRSKAEVVDAACHGINNNKSIGPNSSTDEAECLELIKYIDEMMREDFGHSLDLSKV